jgi:hypothetical protein
MHSFTTKYGRGLLVYKSYWYLLEVPTSCTHYQPVEYGGQKSGNMDRGSTSKERLVDTQGRILVTCHRGIMPLIFT